MGPFIVQTLAEHLSLLRDSWSNKLKYSLKHKKKLTLDRKKRLIASVARIAQSVEQRIENPRVPGSIPGSGTIFRFGG